MATYTITVNERTTSGKALMDYLHALDMGAERYGTDPKTQSFRIEKLLLPMAKFHKNAVPLRMFLAIPS